MRNAKRVTQSEERAARNEVFFRESNEQLGEKRRALDLDGLTPFICECDDPDCTDLVRLTLEQYEHVRAHANWFLVAGGHHEDNAKTAEAHDGYVIVEKLGLAGRIAEEHNPRA